MAAVAPVQGPEAQIAFRGNRRLRRDSEHLTKLDIQNDNHNNPLFHGILSAPTEEETRTEGRELFKQFVVHELHTENVETPDEIRAELCTPLGYENPAWAKAGRELRRLADDFMRSKERRQVRSNAASITRSSDEVTEGQFRDLLSELLAEGITKERIVVLFFFCADVAIETLRRQAQSSIQLCQRFIQWSINFISERVCSWVQANGGWGVVFRSTMVIFRRVAVIISVGMVCYFGYKKFIKSN